MEAWCSRLQETGQAGRHFARTLMEEEGRKLARLTALSATIGLPLHNNYLFKLPREIRQMIRQCRALKRLGWKLSFRLTGKDGRLLFRDVDADVDEVTDFAENLPRTRQSAARLSPYKEPTVSGTLLAASGSAWLEIVYGPHYWLTKSAPPDVQILSCSYRFPQLSVQYSTEDENLRAFLFKQLRDILRITLGVRVRMLAELNPSVYAEYHWHSDFGYRFLECSYARVWTCGPAPSMRNESAVK